MNTNLIYCTAFLGKETLYYLQAFLLSMKVYSQMDTFDILILTSNELLKDVNLLSKQCGIELKTLLMESNTIQETFLSRFKIFEYEKINQYSKLFYLDTDILIHRDVTQLFNLAIEDKIYCVNEPNVTIESIYHGGTFFNFKNIKKNTPGINAGAILFNNTLIAKDLFKTILEHASRLTETLANVDQALLNYHCYTKNLFGPNTLGDYIFMSNKICPASPLTKDIYVMNHFYGGGTRLPKKIRIMYHLQHIIESKPGIDDNKILFKQYSWDYESILFEKDKLLITPWGRGTYEYLGNNIYRASWAKILHVLIFNKDLTEYTSINVNYWHIGSGKIENVLMNTIPPPSKKLDEPVVGNKYLVYFCVFHNKMYLELLELLLLSLKIFSPYNETIEFLILTSESFIWNIHKIINNLQMPVNVKVFNFQTQHEAACSRLHIFEYEFINRYSKILYLDTDIIIQGDIMKLFDCLKEDMLYAKKDNTINSQGHGGCFFDSTNYSRDTPSLNSGVLLFKNSAAIRSLFYDVNLHIKNLKAKTSLLPPCMDQPFLAYHSIKNSMCNLEAISDYICLCDDTTSDSKTIVSHFILPFGNASHKINRMKVHFKTLLEDYSKVAIHSSILLNKSYSFKEDTITFKSKGLLQTNKGAYKYSMINKTTAALFIMNNSYIFYLHDSERPNILPLCLNIQSLSYSLEKRIPSFNVLLATIGRPSLQRMLYSLSFQLSPVDCLTVVFDNTDKVPPFDFSKFVCKVNIHCEPVKLGYWGHGIRNKYANLLEKRDFIMHGDDDDMYTSDCFDFLRKNCTNPDTLYIGKNIEADGRISIEENNIRIGHAGTTSGIIPYDLNKEAIWGNLYGGDGIFIKQIELKAKGIHYLPYINYLIRPDIANFNKNIYCFWTGVTNQGLECLNKLNEITQSNVILVTPDNLHTYILKDHPLHPAYEYLSETHRSDYLIAYFMNFYGGGYSDIKEPSSSWENSFSDLYNSNYWICGFHEMGERDIGYENYKGRWKDLIGTTAFICKANTLLTNEWYNEMIELMNLKLPSLVDFAKSSQDQSYPIGSTEMLGKIYHKVCYKYKNYLLKTLPKPITGKID